jgi:hypothetical protein
MSRPEGRTNGHDMITHAVGLAEAQCPYCLQPISNRQQFEEIRTRVEEEERARIAKVEQTLKDRFARETAKAEATKKTEITRAIKEATKVADTKMKALRANQDEVVAARLEAQRQTFEKTTASAVLAERAKYLGEKLKLEEQLQDMQRRLQAKTAHQLGEPAEADLYEALAMAFPDDRVSRVVKGMRGPDVLIEVIDHGEVVGKIVLDSKNRARWSNKFTTKLRSDQIAEGADHAILSSSVFPAGTQQLYIQDGVIVASPQRVVVLVHLLRKQIIDNFVQKLGAEARNEKADRLYTFILSPAADDLFDRLLKLTRDLSALDTTEVKAHQATRAKRAELVQSVVAIREQFCGVVAEIVGGGR